MTNPARIEEGMPFDQYQAQPGISHSILKHMDPTPAHCHFYALAPPEPPTEERLLGTLLHSALLTPSESLPIAVRPPGMKFTTIAGKRWRDDQQAAGKTILSEEDYTTVEALARRARESPLCRSIFARGRGELSVWVPMDQSAADAPWLKARIDWVPDEGNALVDMKVLRDASPNGFRRAMMDFGYHTQAAWYLDVWAKTGQPERSCFVFLVFEKIPPYLVAAYQLGAASIQAGRKINERRLSRYLECWIGDDWPGYSDDVEEIDLPQWATLSLQ